MGWSTTCPRIISCPSSSPWAALPTQAPWSRSFDIPASLSAPVTASAARDLRFLSLCFPNLVMAAPIILTFSHDENSFLFLPNLQI